MSDYTEHIDGVLARIEAQWPYRKTVAVVGEPLDFKMVNLRAKIDVEEFIAELKRLGRERGLQIPKKPEDE